MIRKIVFLLAALGLLLSGCNLPQGQAGAAQAWIDAPLDGMILPLAPYTIVFHASAPLGVTQMEVSLNGQVLADLPNPDPAQGLVSLSQPWQPAQPGSYVIAVRAQDQAGNWTTPDSVTVVVQPATPTPTPTPTASATISPTPTSLPTATPGPVFSALRVSTNVFYRITPPVPGKISPPDTRLHSVTFTVKVDDPAGIRIAELYFCLKDPQSGSTTPWHNAAMSDQGNGIYSYTLNSQDPALTPSAPKTMTLEYQFIVTHPDLSLVRGPVFADITLQGY